MTPLLGRQRARLRQFGVSLETLLSEIAYVGMDAEPKSQEAGESSLRSPKRR